MENSRAAVAGSLYARPRSAAPQDVRIVSPLQPYGSWEVCPLTVHRLVVRPRLVELAGARWHRRVVAIVAGAGFGKSVLLAQATAENALAPRGVDLAVGCTAADHSPAHFLGRLADAIGASTESGRPMTPERLMAEMSRRWPLGVCLVVDDAHHLAATGDGERLLARLVNEAPATVHFMLASQKRLRALAEVHFAGQAVDIGEHDLAMSDAETLELARVHGVDASVVASVGRWPALASVTAAYGIRSATDFVWDRVIDHLTAGERRVLAIAATIGGGDAALLGAAVGDATVEPAKILASVPLVSRSDTDEFIVHDLWHRVVGEALAEGDRRAAVARAIDVLLDRRAYDRAFGLCAAQRDWDGAASVLIACCRRGHPEVRADVLAGWLEVLPSDRWERAEGLLLRGLVGRVTDPFGPDTATLLERAAERYRAAGNVTGEMAAINDLAYVARNQGRFDALPALLARAGEVRAAGHREAEGLVAIGRSLMAEMAGDDQRMVAELDAVPAGSLSRDWQAAVAFRQTIGHLTLGNEHEMLAAAADCAARAGDTTARHALALAQWYAGDPAPALASCDAIAADASRSRVDAVALGSFATMVLATAGRLGRASDHAGRHRTGRVRIDVAAHARLRRRDQGVGRRRQR